MKLVTLSLAAISGAGFLFHNQLQSLVHQGSRGTSGSVQHHQAPAGVYYLRTAYTFAGPGGTTHWSAGQELRTAADTLVTNGMVTLTDGQNSAPLPETAVTQDMDDAATLRQLEASSQNAVRQPAAAPRQPPTVPQANSDRLVAGQFHSTSLDAPTVRTNLPENIVSTAGAPVVYSSSYYNNTVIVGQTTRVIPRREIVVQQRQVQPRNTPAPVKRNY